VRHVGKLDGWGRLAKNGKRRLGRTGVSARRCGTLAGLDGMADHLDVLDDVALGLAP
jgi:hypothetical protein